MPHTNYWTDADRMKLRKFVAEGLTADIIAERLGRGPEAIRHQLAYLGLNRKSVARAKDKRPSRNIPRPGKSTLPPL